MSTPVRIDGELFEAARTAGQTLSRSAAQQVAHWARIGQQLEASPLTTTEIVRQVLEGQSPYDDVDDRTQAIVRATWAEDIADRIAGLDLTPKLAATGVPWAEGDEHGRPVMRGGPAAPVR